MTQHADAAEPALSGAGGGPAGLAQKATGFRWVICGLLFYATTVNYVDRSVLNAMAPMLQGIIKWRDYEYGLIGAAFTLAYGIGFLLMGNIVDKIGTRLGYAFALSVWTLAAVATALTSTPLQFGMARFLLGLGEAGNFPAAIKTVAEWFPQKQRATATGIFNAGSNVGAVLAPLIALVLVPHFGWRSAFLVTPVLAIVWIALWLALYRTPANQPRANDAERRLIEADHPSSPRPVKWRHLLPHPQAWAFMIGKSLTDPIWWFYLFWSGKFFNAKFGVNLSGVALPLIYIYLLADVGSVGGGWLSSSLIRRGWSVNAARKTAMIVCAAFVLPVVFAPLVPREMAGGLWVAATLIGFAAAAHQGFSANLFTTGSDMFPKRAVSSVTGLGGVSGSLTSVVLQTVAGMTLELTHRSYLILFIIAGCAYPLAVLAIHLFAPHMKAVSEDALEAKPMPRAVTAFVFALVGAIVAVPLSYEFQNHRQLHLLDRAGMMTQTFDDEVNAQLPRDLVEKATVKAASSGLITVDIKLKRKPTAAESALIATLKAFPDRADEAAFEHTRGFTFAEYMAAVLPPGNIFLSVDRSALIPPLIWTPLGGLVAGALLGILLHGLLFSQWKA